MVLADSLDASTSICLRSLLSSMLDMKSFWV